MERWKNEKDRDVWRENIVFAVKYGLEHSNHNEKLQKLNETIQENDEKIQEICLANQKTLTENLKQFTDINQDITEISDKIKTFENNIQVIIKMNIYNSKKACSFLEAKKNVDSVIGILGDIQDFVTNVEKAVTNVRGDNFMASLRILNGLKKANLITHPANASMRKILSEVLPLINGKIRKLTDDLLNEWMKQLKVKRSEYARFLINKIDEGNQRKAARPTMGQGGRASIARDSIANDTRFGNSFRSSISRAGGFQRQSTMMLGIDTKFLMNTKGYRDYSNKELSQELKIDFYLVNQCKQIYENLNETPLLYEKIIAERRKQLLQASDSEHNIQLHEVKNYFANLISYFLIQKEIEQTIPQVQDINQLWVDAGKMLEKEINKVVELLETKDDYLNLKNDLQVFIVIMNKFGFSSQALLLNEILKTSFIKFSEKMIRDARDNFMEKFKKDPHRPLIARNLTELREYTVNFEIDKIIGLNLHVDPAKNKYPVELNYTQIIPDTCQIVSQFIDDNVQFMQGNPDREDILFIQLDRLLYEIYRGFYEEVSSNTAGYSPLQIAQIYQNAIISQKLMTYYKKCLEKASGFQYKTSLESKTVASQIIYACDEIICESIKSMINKFLADFENFNWEPTAKAKERNDELAEALKYLNSNLLTMKTILPENTVSVAFVAFKHINDFLMSQLFKAKNFNNVGLANLDLEIIHINNVCETSLKSIEGLRECFRPLRQLLDLFLNGPINKFTKADIRKAEYFCLDPVKLIPFMEKYKNPKVDFMKELRKRDVDAVIKELKKEFRLK